MATGTTPPIKRFAGVNRAVDPDQIADNELVETRDFYPITPGVIALRPITTLLAYVDSQNINQSGSMAFMEFKTLTGETITYLWRHVIYDNPAFNYGQLFEVMQENAGHPTLSGTAPMWLDDMVLTDPSPNRPGWVVFNNKLYMFFGPQSLQSGYVLDGTLRELFHTNRASIDAGASWSEQIRPGIVAIYRNTFCLAGFEPPFGSTIRFCDIGDPATLLDLTKSAEVQGGDGDDITALVNVMVEGGAQAFEPYLLVGKRNSVHMIQGYPPTSTDLGNLSRVPLIPDEGIITKETVTLTPYGPVWCSGKNVWMAPNGQKPIKIGDEIAPRLMASPHGDLNGWHAVYHDGFYKLTIPCVDGSDLYTDAALYIPHTEAWWCDLREFNKDGEYTWWGPMTMAAQASFVSRQTDKTTFLQSFLHKQTDIDGVTQARLMVVDAHTPAGENGRYIDAHILYNTQGEFDLTPMLLTKEHDGGDPMITKIIDAIELNCFTESNIRINVQLIGDGGSIVQTLDQYELAAAGIMLGTDPAELDFAVMSKKFQSIALFPPNGGRFLANTWQIRLTLSPGILSNQYMPLGRFQLRAFTYRVRPIGRRPDR